MAVSSTTAPRTLRAARELPNVAWALLVSRLIVWAFAILGQAALGYSFWRGRADPTNLTAQLGDVGEVLGAPVMRWDSVYYLQIAQDGYTQRKQAGFFPLYPLLMDALDAVTRSTVVAGVLISVVAFAAGLVLFQRLARLETASDAVARRAVWLLALFPASLFFSAVYTEGLFLALSVGAFYSARRGRWAWAGILGGLAAATRNVGVMLLVPLALLYLYGPRDDRPGRRGRFPLRADAAWLALVPLGCAAVAYGMWRTFDDPFTAWTSQESYFGRHFKGPFSGVVLGAIKPFQDLAHGSLGGAVNKGALFVVAVAALAVCVAMLRRLPVAYGAYGLASLAPSLSTPHDAGPLNGSIRYVAVVFPIFLAVALWLEGRPRLTLALGTVSALALAYCSVRFGSWRWVA